MASFSKAIFKVVMILITVVRSNELLCDLTTNTSFDSWQPTHAMLDVYGPHGCPTDTGTGCVLLERSPISFIRKTFNFTNKENMKMTFDTRSATKEYDFALLIKYDCGGGLFTLASFCPLEYYSPFTCPVPRIYVSNMYLFNILLDQQLYLPQECDNNPTVTIQFETIQYSGTYIQNICVYDSSPSPLSTTPSPVSVPNCDLTAYGNYDSWVSNSNNCVPDIFNMENARGCPSNVYGNGCLYFSAGNYIEKVFDMTDKENIQLHFKMQVDKFQGTGAIWVKVDCGSGLQTLMNYCPNDYYPTTCGFPRTLIQQLTVISLNEILDLPSTCNNKSTVTIRFEGWYNANLWIQNICITNTTQISITPSPTFTASNCDITTYGSYDGWVPLSTSVVFDIKNPGISRGCPFDENGDGCLYFKYGGRIRKSFNFITHSDIDLSFTIKIDPMHGLNLIYIKYDCGNGANILATYCNEYNINNAECLSPSTFVFSAQYTPLLNQTFRLPGNCNNNNDVSITFESSNTYLWLQYICTSGTFSTINPTTNIPTTLNPTTTNPTLYPTIYPTQTPTFNPSKDPTLKPTTNPTVTTIHPTNDPTVDPTSDPTKLPTFPTYVPTNPTTYPTSDPTINPSVYPTSNPTVYPTHIPTNPTNGPTFYPTFYPSNIPTFNPTIAPTILPTDNPSLYPTSITSLPSISPTPTHTTNFPTIITSNIPTLSPTTQKRLHFICYYKDDEDILTKLTLSEYGNKFMNIIIKTIESITSEAFYYNKATKNALNPWIKGGVLNFTICNIFDTELDNVNFECPVYLKNSNEKNKNIFISVGVFDIISDNELNQYQEWIVSNLESQSFKNMFTENMNDELTETISTRRRLLEYDAFKAIRFMIVDPMNDKVSEEQTDGETIILIVVIIGVLFVLIILSLLVYLKYKKQSKEQEGIPDNKQNMEQEIEMNELQNIDGHMHQQEKRDTVDKNDVVNLMENMNDVEMDGDVVNMVNDTNIVYGESVNDDVDDNEIVKEVNETAFGQVEENNNLNKQQDLSSILNEDEEDMDILETVNETDLEQVEDNNIIQALNETPFGAIEINDNNLNQENYLDDDNSQSFRFGQTFSM
eukprot:134522_1